MENNISAKITFLDETVVEYESSIINIPRTQQLSIKSIEVLKSNTQISFTDVIEQ